MKIDTLTIVGVGLIGGSIGLAAKERGLVRRVVGAGRTQASLERARNLGAVDEISLDLAAAVHQADLAVFCTPVEKIVEQVLAAAPGCRTGTLLTDAGSAKGVIVRGIEGKLPGGVVFVGSHPLAGSHRRGPDHADAQLFQHRMTVVTRTPATDARALEQTVAFWQSLGSRVRVMEPDAHDQALALTSHLPHLMASALAGILPAELVELAATGFRDTTRIAAGDLSLWTGIFAQNRGGVLAALSRLEERLGLFRAALEADDAAALDQLLAEGKKVRDALDA